MDSGYFKFRWCWFKQSSTHTEFLGKTITTTAGDSTHFTTYTSAGAYP